MKQCLQNFFRRNILVNIGIKLCDGTIQYTVYIQFCGFLFISKVEEK